MRSWVVREAGMTKSGQPWGGPIAKLTPLDELYLQRAYELALRGTGNTEPNPPVGAVVVRAGRIVGEGYHHRAGSPHAETNALRASRRECARRNALRFARALRAHRPHAAVHARAHRCRRRPRRRRNARSHRPRRRRASCASKASRSSLPAIRPRRLDRDFCAWKRQRAALRRRQNGDVARRRDRARARRARAAELGAGAALRPRAASALRCGDNRCGNDSRRRSAAHRAPAPRPLASLHPYRRVRTRHAAGGEPRVCRREGYAKTIVLAPGAAGRSRSPGWKALPT